MRSSIPPVLVLLAAALGASVALAQDGSRVARENRARITLTPPAGFEVAKEFAGYRQPTTGALIRVAHLSMTYDDARVALSSELLASRGAVEASREDVSTIDRRKGTLISVERRHERLELREMMLLVGDQTGAALVTATYAMVYESQLRLPLRTALLSTRWAAQSSDVRRAPHPTERAVSPRPVAPPRAETPPLPGPVAPPRPPAPQPTGATPPAPRPPAPGPTATTPPRPAEPETARPAEPGSRAPPKPTGALPRPARTGRRPREVTPTPRAPDQAALLAQLPFALDESRLFPTRRALGGGLSLAAAGKEGRWSDPLFSVFSRERVVPAGPGRDEFVRKLVEQSGAFQSVTPETSGAVRIDGLDGIRSIAVGVFEGGGDALVFKVVLFDSADYYALTGRCALGERETYLGDFDRLAQSFRRADWAK